MRTIRHTKTLFYLDGPQVIEANDNDGQNYIGVMVEPDGVRERFVLKSVAPDRLNQLRLGRIDLRSMFLEHSEDEWFLGTVSTGFDEPFTLERHADRIDECPFLPAPGFFLSALKSEKENPSGLATGGVSAGKPLQISPPPLRREVAGRWPRHVKSQIQT